MSEQLARGADHHESTTARVSRSLGDAVKVGSDRWEEAFWSSNRASTTVVPRRRNVVWTEQGELFGNEPQERTSSKTVSVERKSVGAPEPRAKAIVPRRSNDQTLRRSTSAPRLQPYAQQSKSVRTADIARFLQVNSAVDGVASTSWFKLPRRTFTAAYEHALWKGREVGTPFVTGC